MPNIKENLKNRFRIGFGKDVKTEHFPVDVASGLDVLMAPDGYKRMPQAKKDSEEFIWENDEGDRLSVNYYTQVNKIIYSAIFDQNLIEDKEEIARRLGVLYSKLNNIIGAISQQLGSPYISSTRELLIEIEGGKLAQKVQLLTPIIQELYTKTEGTQLFNVDTLEQTNSSVQMVFGSQD
ncbi:MAG: hypothetical protein NTY81_02320 [Candidatus Staskawiczbacteria bacterium]|nr:hypothetical protein [Candidatus Staskawiczbacteria bacterium]